MGSAGPEHRRAVADVIGALCHALLRVFHLAADAAVVAPSVELADRQTAFALEELDRYRVLRAHLAGVTDDVDAAVRSLREPIESFYGAARPEDWLQTQVFAFVGSAITTDFAELVAPRLDPPTADAVREALTGRTAQEAFALEQIGEALSAGAPAVRDQIAHFAGKIVGEGLTTLRGALERSDAVAEVLGDQDAVKELVLEMLGRHRERLERLGLDALD